MKDKIAPHTGRGEKCDNESRCHVTKWSVLDCFFFLQGRQISAHPGWFLILWQFRAEISLALNFTAITRFYYCHSEQAVQY